MPVEYREVSLEKFPMAYQAEFPEELPMEFREVSLVEFRMAYPAEFPAAFLGECLEEWAGSRRTSRGNLTRHPLLRCAS